MPCTSMYSTTWPTRYGVGRAEMGKSAFAYLADTFRHQTLLFITFIFHMSWEMIEIRHSYGLTWIALLFLSTCQVLGEPVHKITTSGPSCSVQNPPPPLNDIVCAPNTTATLADARALAWKFAPVLKFHPLEPYHLQVRLR